MRAKRNGRPNLKCPRIQNHQCPSMRKSTPAMKLHYLVNFMTLDDSGALQKTGGALIPQGYQLYKDDQYPWICPVRSCRILSKSLWALGAHFSGRHRTEDLNDNLDGTLSVVKKRGLGPPKITSWGHVDLKTCPMAVPQLNTAIKAFHSRMRKPLPSFLNLGGPGTLARPSGLTLIGSTAPTTGSGAGKLHARSNWLHIRENLDDVPQSPISKRYQYIADLLETPRVRDIQYNNGVPRRSYEGDPQEIAAMAVQMTGTRVPHPCSRCREGRGPFKGCYVISAEAPLRARQAMTRCGNCLGKSNKYKCEVSQWVREKYREIGRRVVPLPYAKPSSIRRDSLHQRKSADQSIVTESAEKIPQDQRPSRHDANDKDTRNPRTSETGRPQTRSHQQAPCEPSLATPSTIDPVQMLQLETWELAPGRIRNDETEIVDNIAFSNSYLAQNQAVKISHDVSFQVITIKPGTVHDFEAISNKLRLCSVASGKLKVKIQSHEFDMGPNGMFKIGSGKSATVLNMLYIDATIHVSAMPGDL
ncbi:hypothetical protein F4780DRAFT_276005 [Xylariomycetidae sp. FL0641]|nr:hypothetical protein F4780DRAFT_276005 [Xylariomycetidae sp. FL0641]